MDKIQSIIFIGFDNSVLTKEIAEIWEPDDMSTTKSDGVTNTSSHMITQATNKPTDYQDHLNPQFTGKKYA